MLSENDFDKKNTTLKQYLEKIDNKALNTFAKQMHSSD